VALRSADELVRANLVHPATAAVTLTECLGRVLFNTETLDENNRWECSCCGAKVCAKKQLRLSKLPTVLIVHLKRFEWDGSALTNTVKKKDRVVFPCGPLEQLDMEPFLVEDSNVDSSTYRLAAVVQHHGACMHGGHYTAVARHQSTDQWYLFDDAATPVRLNAAELHANVVNSTAYMLLYQRCV